MKQYATTQEIERARILRVNNTEVEKLLWYRLRNRQIDGFKFRRQHPIANYTLDFACEEKKLVIELDGGQHTEKQRAQKDAQRTGVLEMLGWRVLRFGTTTCWKISKAF